MLVSSLILHLTQTLYVISFLFQFERRSITPSTLEAKIRNFHVKYGAKDKDINTLPGMRVYDEVIIIQIIHFLLLRSKERNIL